MSLSVRALDQSQVWAFLTTQFGCRGPSEALHAALIADHIRTLVFAPYLRPGEPGPQPMHTSRIFSALDRNIRFLFSSQAGESVPRDHSIYEFVRDQLARCGDIIHVGSGYWIPGPMRVFRGSASQSRFIIGGIPTSALQRKIKEQIHSIGPARYLRYESSSSVPYPEEMVSDWIGPMESLAAWTEKTLAWAMTQLQPEANIEDDSIEIYAPDVFRTRGWVDRWCEAKEFREPTPMLRLFRPRTAARWAFDRPDFLGLFNSSPTGAQLTRSVRIPRDMAFRLRFGFDQKLGTQRTINLRRVGEIYSLHLKFGWPEPEAKVLGLSWCITSQSDERFFDALALPVLKDVAALLNIRVLQK